MGGGEWIVVNAPRYGSFRVRIRVRFRVRVRVRVEIFITDVYGMYTHNTG